MKKTTLILWIVLLACTTRTLAQNAPVSKAGDVITTATSVIVPITASNFTNISSCELKLFFDQTIASATLVTANPLLSGTNTTLSYIVSFPGVVNFGWAAGVARTVPDNTPIFYIHFSKLVGYTFQA